MGNTAGIRQTNEKAGRSVTVIELIEQLRNLPPNATVICGLIDGSKWEISHASLSSVKGPDGPFVELSSIFNAYRDVEFPTFSDKLQELTQYSQDLGMYSPEVLSTPNPLVRAP